MSGWRAVPLLSVLAAAGCGGTTPTPVHDVDAVVFYDENGNGVPDTNETARVPGAQLIVLGAGITAETAPATGLAVLRSVPEGDWAVGVNNNILPPYYKVGSAVALHVPQTDTAMIPATLPIGSNVPNRYMAFGDSITDGEGATDEIGYRGILEQRLRDHFGKAEMVDAAVGGTSSLGGAERIRRVLRSDTPAYTIILYGTNDWVDPVCQTDACFTVDSLRSIIQSARAANSLPILGTIPPGNPAFPQVPPERLQWISQMNDQIRVMARQEGVPLADDWQGFINAGDLTQLFVDHVHPNDRGHAIIAEAFFTAITQASTQTATMSTAAGGAGSEAPGLEPQAEVP
jgi:lysophospholipase L1-like esterase